MLLTLSTTHRPATDLGYLLMKHPDNVHANELPFGRATIFYPEATEERCTAALTLEVDPVELVRGKGAAAGLQDQYVNDRPYAASSLLAVALGRMLGTTMGGRSKLRQELADTPIPLEAVVTPLPARGGGAALVARLFEPLGYTVAATPIPMDPAHPEWGDSPYVELRLTGEARLSVLLNHLFVLVPVLDNSKHYYIGEDEVQKLLRKGEGWLDAHPERELIVRRYLKGFKSLVRSANRGLDESVEAEAAEETAAKDAAEEALERPIRLNDVRMDRVVETLKLLGAASVVDLGCGEGRLLRQLLKQRGFTRIVGLEVAPRVLAAAADRLRLESMPDLQRKRIELLQGSLVYRDDRLNGFDAAAVVEVIEHMDLERLPAFEQALFGHARPAAIVLTTPNAEYNALFPNLGAGRMRHPDHRFEWTRSELAHWAGSVALAYGYSVRFEPVGEEHPLHGAPTQMAVFTIGREDPA
ncbi:MAG TPA: 3' terminal RNA ribose 2'-O-methyltransferase Hen1 [Allosphingosinicella sp.]|nr:3' terminal RNA ribose 2'-O-methyltransferase Hen1 [Allosphingosinicella sp.]